MPKKLPSNFKKYFWDTDFSTIDPDKNKIYIIKRILDRGNAFSVKWIIENYQQSDLIETITKTRDMSKKTGNFWADYFGINKSSVACLQKPYSPTPFGLSS